MCLCMINIYSLLVTFYRDTSNAEIDGRIRAVLERKIPTDTPGERHLLKLLKKLLTTNISSLDELDELIDTKIDAIVTDGDSDDLKDLLRDMMAMDLTNNDELVDQVLGELGSSVSGASKARLRLFLEDLIHLRTSRRLTMAQVKQHSYFTNKDGTTTLQGRQNKEKVDGFLASLSEAVENLTISVEDLGDDQERILTSIHNLSS